MILHDRFYQSQLEVIVLIVDHFSHWPEFIAATMVYLTAYTMMLLQMYMGM